MTRILNLITGGTFDACDRCHILRSYYKHVVGSFFSSRVEGSEKGMLFELVMGLPFNL